MRPLKIAAGNIGGREDAINANKCIACKAQHSERQIRAWPMSTQEEYVRSGCCRICQARVFGIDLTVCTCNDPCCSVDVGVGVITCGEQHCPVHGDEAGLREYDQWQESA